MSTAYPYFAEHPVEWAEFEENPGDGFSGDHEKPITWCAHRELRWYSDYILERYQSDASGLVKQAVQSNRRRYKEFSRHVHAVLDHTTRRPITEAFDEIGQKELRAFSNAQRDVFSSVLILATAPSPASIGSLTAMERAWFDWVLGTQRQKLIRGGKFLTA